MPLIYVRISFSLPFSHRSYQLIIKAMNIYMHMPSPEGAHGVHNVKNPSKTALHTDQLFVHLIAGSE